MLRMVDSALRAVGTFPIGCNTWQARVMQVEVLPVPRRLTCSSPSPVHLGGIITMVKNSCDPPLWLLPL